MFYLTNRYQYVSLGQTESEPQPVSSQFSAHYNDFSNCFEILDLYLFADDANLFYKHKNIKFLESKVNNEIVNIHTCLNVNKLSLNIERSNFFH